MAQHLNGPQHYRQAQVMLEQASMEIEMGEAWRNQLIAMAQAHAVLALTAITVGQVQPSYGQTVQWGMVTRGERLPAERVPLEDRLQDEED